MPTSIGIRTPAEVIQIALEDCGIASAAAKAASEEAAKRLAIALRSISSPKAEVIIYSPSKHEIQWGMAVQTKGGA